MLSVRLAVDHQYGKLLLTWLSLVMSLMGPFCSVFSLEMSWMRSGTELSTFLRVFLPTLGQCHQEIHQGLLHFHTCEYALELLQTEVH